MEVSTPRAAAEPAAAAKPASSPPQEKTLPPLDFAFHTLLLPLKKSLARIEAKLAENGVAPANPETIPMVVATAAPQSTEEDSLAPLVDRLDHLATELTEFRREALQRLPSHSPPPAEAPEIVPTLTPAEPEILDATWHDTWEEIIFGSELSGNAALNAVRQEFLNDVVSGVVSARALAGQLLLLQTTPVDELPERFRHVGEAYYRWHPRASTAEDHLEEALANWLARRADDAGLRNSIQLVRPGDRFDSTRHSATTRGVEVVAVHGWIVLRDNTKVYTKASVTVQ